MKPSLEQSPSLSLPPDLASRSRYPLRLKWFNKTPYTWLTVFAEALEHIENQFVEVVPKLWPEAPLKDWSSSSTLNRSTTLPMNSSHFWSRLKEYGGIGVELGWVENEHRIVNIVENSPAEDAGLEPQDTIVAVNQKPVQNLNTQQLHEILTGSVGTQVVLSVMRETFEKPWNFTLTRQWVRRPSFKVQELEPDILYVDIHLFSRGVGRAWKSNARPQAPKALILDLRDNPGGLFDEAVHVANLFLSKGPLSKRRDAVEQSSKPEMRGPSERFLNRPSPF